MNNPMAVLAAAYGAITLFLSVVLVRKAWIEYRKSKKVKKNVDNSSLEGVIQENERIS